MTNEWSILHRQAFELLENIKLSCKCSSFKNTLAYSGAASAMTDNICKDL